MFELDPGMFARNRQIRLSERLGDASIAKSEVDAAEDQQKMRQKRAAELLGMASPDNWPALRQQAISEGIATPDVVPEAYDQGWIERARSALGGGASSLPSSVQEFNFYKKLATPDQDTFMNLKRGPQTMNLGDRVVVRTPYGDASESYPKGLPPEDVPAIKGDQAREAATGKAEGEAQGAIQKKIIAAPQIEDYLKQAEKLLPDATSGGAQTAYRDVNAWFGNATDGSKTDSQLDVIGAALTSGVPRMEGPQSNYDVQLYEKAAGDLANSKAPRETRLAAIQTIREINNKYREKSTLNLDSPINPPINPIQDLYAERGQSSLDRPAEGAPQQPKRLRFTPQGFVAQ